jgi:hypothetical protein
MLVALGTQTLQFFDYFLPRVKFAKNTAFIICGGEVWRRSPQVAVADSRQSPISFRAAGP